MPANGEAVELTFDHRLADHLAADRLYYKSTLTAKVDRVVAALLVVLGTLVTWKAGPRWWTLIWFPLAFAEWFNLLTLRPLQIMYWFKQNPKFRETYHLTFGAGGIRFRTATIDALIQWTHYTRMLEGPRLFLLIYGSRMFSVIPKRAFASESEQNAFRTLVGSHLSPSTGSPPESS